MFGGLVELQDWALAVYKYEDTTKIQVWRYPLLEAGRVTRLLPDAVSVCRFSRVRLIAVVQLYSKRAKKEFSSFLKASGCAYAYMDVSIDGEPAGRVIFQLFLQHCPETYGRGNMS